MATRQEIERRRAEFAWEKVRDVKDIKEGNYGKEYRALAHSAGADIQSSGLGQTLAFWRAKQRTSAAHAALYEHISQWVCKEVSQSWHDMDLLQKLIERDVSNDLYRRATIEAASVLVWLKRFAEAELSD